MSAPVYPIPDILPPKEHPRVMLRRGDFSRVRASLCDPDASLAREQFDRLCAFDVRGAEAERLGYHLTEYLALEARALRALLDGDARQGRAVIGLLMPRLQRESFRDERMSARYCGHLIFLCAQVYDWCYCWLTEEEKSEIIARCEQMAQAYLEIGYPPVRQSAVSGHGGEAQLLRDLLAFSIAVYDERPDLYHTCAGRLFSEFLPAYQTCFRGRFHPQGPCYGAYRYSWTLWFGLLIASMSGCKILPEDTVATADSFLYLRRSDGQALRLGDDYNEKKAPYTRDNPFAVPLFLAAAYSGDGLWRREAERQLCAEYLVPSQHGADYYAKGAYGEGAISPTVYLIWNRFTPLSKVRALPAARYFDRPVGCTVYNDGERLVLMKIGCLWGANHDHLDTGCFQIYDGEILASDSGVYDTYASEHRKRYATQTVAHNCLTVAGKGTRVPCEKKEPKSVEIWASEYGMATVLRHVESDALCEIVGDLSEAYRETCRSVIRTMRWEPNRGERGLLTVSDEVEPKDPNAEVCVLLHCQTPPVIEGNTIVIHGKNRSLFGTVKASKDVSITAVGGEGREFEADGVCYPPIVRTSECGWGRIVITARGSVSFELGLEIRKRGERE